MDTVNILSLGREAVWVVILVAGPVLLAALAAGLIIGVLQAATSVQEMTLSFIPKLAVLAFALLIFGEFQLNTLVDFFSSVFDRIPAALDE